MTDGGRNPVSPASGETRTVLEDRDKVIILARCHRDGFASIDCGECQAAILSAR